ncbi:MAG: agmatinase family protein [Gammaproteobacteria bacterium]|nr:agmatinase family protein [Gammaproteobacteria bacterium]NND60668.1 agmatinase family protein [Gammaproteobacteria bacterium]
MTAVELNLRPVELLGLESDSNSSFLRGPARAPAAIRRVLDSGASNLCSENGIDLARHPLFARGHDHAIADNESDFLGIEAIVAELLDRGGRPLILGGDHAVTYPVLRAIAARHGPVSILHFDAHADIYQSFDDNRYSHASPFARILEDGLAQQLVQVGIRTLNDHQRMQVARYGVIVHEARRLDLERVADSIAAAPGPLYISVDIDVLDPSCAPGVSHHEPGGMTVREVLGLVQSIRTPVAGADIVEYNPTRDINDMTAAVAVKLMKEIAAVMLSCHNGDAISA